LKFFNRFKKKSNEKTTPSKMSFGYIVRHFYVEFLIIFAFAFLLTLMFPKGKSYEFANLKEGGVYIGDEIIAPFTFPVNKSQEDYALDIKKAEQSVAPVFLKKDDPAEEQLQKLKIFTDHIKIVLKNSTTTPELLKSVFTDDGIIISDEAVFSILTSFKQPSEQSQNRLAGRVKEFENLAGIIYKLTQELFSVGILDKPKDQFMQYQSKISVQYQNREMVENLQYYSDMQEAAELLLTRLREEGLENENKIKLAYLIGSHFLRPNIIYDEQETNTRKDNAVANVPLAKDQVLAGERIVDSHQRLTKQHIEKLNSLAQAKAERGETQGFWKSIQPFVGKFLLILSFFFVLVFFLFKHHPQIVRNRKEMLLIGLNFLFIAIVTFLCNKFSLSSYIIPVTTVSIIITIFFNAQVGILVTFVLALLVGAMRGSEYLISFTSMFVGAVAILTVSKVRNRNWIIRSGLLITSAYILVIFINNLINYLDGVKLLSEWGVGIMIGFISPGIAYLLIIILESVFDLTTDMSLLELSDFNHPLLRQMHLEAPGTYHHSYLVGMLAETAAEALNANALLARVGAYYHDIGKLEKPEYFVENQTRGRNPQEKLTPTMSSLILSNHVRRGAEIAKEYGLPKEITDFIYQHHGTSMMQYFYQKAIEKNENKTISENEFRYPGPRPQLRETAIVMLADVVEASSRTLKDPSPSRIKGLVEKIIDDKFESGELDESPLTLKDLSKISEAFQKVLNGRFHGRIEYPDDKQKKEEHAKPNNNRKDD